MTTAIRRRVPIAALAAGVLAGSVSGHVDDPKELEILPPHPGPGWRAADGPAVTASLAGPLDGGGGPGIDQFARAGMTLRSWITVPEFPGGSSNANDCWGWTSPAGREYAIVGLSLGTAFVEVTDPDAATIVDLVPAPFVVQRDVKVFGHHASIGGESGSHGVQVVDLSELDAGTVTLARTLFGDGTENTHNIAIDPVGGFLYRCGGGGNGLRIYDLNQDPTDPVPVGWWPDRYVHDAQVVTYESGPSAGRRIAYCCGGFNGGFVETGLDVLDVTDPGNVEVLSRIVYPGGAYSHQGWLSPDRTRFYLSDELDESSGIPSTIHVFDVADPADAQWLGTFTNGLGSTTHNLYTQTRNGRDLIFAANYSSGIRVFDATGTDEPVEIAFFDTRPENDDANFQGLWSCHPFFASGKIIGTDRTRGLFVWSLDDLGPACPADLDGDDAMVNTSDLLALLAGWGDDAPGAALAEPVDVVGAADLLVLLAAWGPCR